MIPPRLVDALMYTDVICNMNLFFVLFGLQLRAHPALPAPPSILTLAPWEEVRVAFHTRGFPLTPLQLISITALNLMFVSYSAGPDAAVHAAHSSAAVSDLRLSLLCAAAHFSLLFSP